ncbi:HVO_A0114 family putative DNA-binding protein [Halorussus pelagicus]|uniref:HVO_A0114 family putative DNA-binding protein n=1 Tax=Halorussus pelagicus TaxID=2505977 RepID=UPI000FFB8C86|nr:transcriptional regulator [Halorussus pelagicus]
MSDSNETNQKDQKLRIESKPWESFKERALESAREFDRGEENGPRVLSFEDPERIQRLLTPRRLELLRSVMENSPGSIRQLSDRLDRNVSDVHDDVTLLEEYGIMELEQNGRAKCPVVPYDEIEIEVTLSLPNGGNSNERSPAAP